ncbi:DNA-binding transcriptional regulator GbsR (MarR family) [Geomicrobium halophilum]|uniref:DNA-binding transcriptional regulator GbsR (MarR family) n=1 Tax=Geomicrobium halophilum TaxID=549000 RepID=A0A841PTJ2_9BACL|nr:hypothetical protein [Geomicrobium halophilum]MBB6451094.1 DNA-binding transcriptional regulator GbsR (MarR family) [Geomicrobium halophilum]
MENESESIREEKETELAKGHDLIKDSIADTMDIYGVTRSVGRIYATLYLNGGPMTLDELRDELGMSKGSISLGVRKLMDDKIIHRVYKKGHRKDLYQAEHDFFSVLRFFLYAPLATGSECKCAWRSPGTAALSGIDR